MNAKKSAKNILWIEDDLSIVRDYKGLLNDKGIDVELYRFIDFEDVRKKILKCSNYDLIIIDVVLTLSPKEKHEHVIESEGGKKGGLLIGRWIKSNLPNLRFVGTSFKQQTEVKKWFEEEGYGFFLKEPSIEKRSFLNFIRKAMGEILSPHEIRSFIVHGHDNNIKLELKNYLQNTLGLYEPIILHEQPFQGRTIIEKFEAYADIIDLVFVILTPDDVVSKNRVNKSTLRQSRQNVLFELGYFYAKLQRKNGKVILLFKGGTTLPSDILGLGYIDISHGIANVGEKIRQELDGFLK